MDSNCIIMQMCLIFLLKIIIIIVQLIYIFSICGDISHFIGKCFSFLFFDFGFYSSAFNLNNLIFEFKNILNIRPYLICEMNIPLGN